LDNFKEKYKDCNKCTKCMNHFKVFGHGNPNADIMIVGEGPGGADVETGIPFSDKAGQLLDNIIKSIGLKKEELYYTNVVICRTNEKDRTPSWEENQNCAERLTEEINLVRPNIILMVGSPSFKRFFGRDSKVSQGHGHWFIDFKPPYARFFSIMHPSWALHSSTPDELKAKKRVLWDDIKTFRNNLQVTNFSIKEDGK